MHHLTASMGPHRQSARRAPSLIRRTGRGPPSRGAACSWAPWPSRYRRPAQTDACDLPPDCSIRPALGALAQRAPWPVEQTKAGSFPQQLAVGFSGFLEIAVQIGLARATFAPSDEFGPLSEQLRDALVNRAGHPAQLVGRSLKQESDAQNWRTNPWQWFQLGNWRSSSWPWP